MTDNQPKRKVNRAKARLQRREEGMEAQRKEAALEALSMPDLRAMETAQMHAKLSTMGLEEYNINADGHCLYSAFADQLRLRYQIEGTFKDLRKQAATYIRANPDAFLPFLLAEESHATPSIETYTDEIENSPRWGGEMEIIALARQHNVAVEVVQAKGAILKFEEENKNKITLARYQHMYSLGAHFNSLRPTKAS